MEMNRVLLGMSFLGAAAFAHADTLVFSTDFDTTVPVEISAGTATLTGVQGYAGLGPAGNQFGGTFLRSATGNVVTLTLTGLPQHSAINLNLLFAAIDSLDGTGTFPSGDFFNVTLDGVSVFRESFANALPSQIQSYVPPPGVELARHVDLGFSGPGSFYTDSAYDLGADPVFHNLAHTGTQATFTFQIEGVGIQDLNDESWAMDNLRVSVTAVPEPSTSVLALAGLGALLLGIRRKPTARP
jgi:MYXO-CTERM domain-containing protein